MKTLYTARLCKKTITVFYEIAPQHHNQQIKEEAEQHAWTFEESQLRKASKVRAMKMIRFK